MNAFDRLSYSIPLADASSFFIKLKTAAVTDPPDETGMLEGEFEAPVEEVIGVMKELVENEFKTMMAYHVYANSLRDLAHSSIAEEFEEHAEKELEHANYLLRRMSVLGGPIQIGEIEPPPASSEATDIIQTMIRYEQEGIAKWKILHSMMGENPSKYDIEQFLTNELHHLDELWQLLPQEAHQPVLHGKALPGMPGDPMAQPLAAPVEPASTESIPAPTDQAGKTAASIDWADKKLVAAADKVFKRTGKKPYTLNMAEDASKLTGSLKAQHTQAGKTHRTSSPHNRSAIRAQVKEIREKSAAAVKMRFSLALHKLADGEIGGAATEGAQMSAPTPAKTMPTNYLAAEQIAQQAQNMNESTFYRQQLETQKLQAQAAQQQAEQQAQQLSEMQNQVAISGTEAQAASQQALQSQQEATQSAQMSANMRLGLERMRTQLMDLAAQDPATPQTPVQGQSMQQQQVDQAAAAGDPNAVAQQQANQGMALDPGTAQSGVDSGIGGESSGGTGGSQGPAVAAEGAQGAPGAAPPAGAAPQNANATGTPPTAATTTPATNLSVKVGSELTEAARDKIKSTNFALSAKQSDTGAPKYPIEDRRHAANALSRVGQFGSPKEKAEVYKDVARKYPEMARHSDVPAVQEKKAGRAPGYTQRIPLPKSKGFKRVGELLTGSKAKKLERRHEDTNGWSGPVEGGGLEKWLAARTKGRRDLEGEYSAVSKARSRAALGALGVGAPLTGASILHKHKKEEKPKKKMAGAAGAAIGATLGGVGGYMESRHADPAADAQRVQGLEARDHSTFGDALALAKAKMRQAMSELSAAHPVAATATGAAIGGLTGHHIQKQMPKILQDSNDLRS